MKKLKLLFILTFLSVFAYAQDIPYLQLENKPSSNNDILVSSGTRFEKVTLGSQFNITGGTININSGTGSGLNADLLDGFNSDYFLNYNNLSGRPWIVNGNNMYSGLIGNVGIGTSNPIAKLQLIGGYYMKGRQTIEYASANSIGGGTALDVYYTAGHVVNTLGTDRSTSNWVLGYAVEPTGVNGQEYKSTASNIAWQRGALEVGRELRFKTAPAATTPVGDIVNLTTRFEVNNTGAVTMSSLSGVGSRIVQANAAGVLSSGIDVSTIYSTSNPQPTNWTLSGNNIYSNNTGFVGIGTTAPVDKLDVRGSIRVQNGQYLKSTNSSDAATRIHGINALNIEYIGSLDQPVASTLIGNNTENLYFMTNNGTRARITGSGDFGIGTTNPTAKLHVAGNALISNLAGVGSRIIQANAAGVLGPGIDVSTIYSTSNPQPDVWNINTQVPTLWRATRNSNVDVRNDIAFQTPTGLKTIFGFDGANTEIDARVGNINFETVGTLRATLTSNGDFGIGTASPTSKLDVNGNASVRGIVSIYSPLGPTERLTINTNDADFSSIYNFNETTQGFGSVALGGSASTANGLLVSGTGVVTAPILAGVGTSALEATSTGVLQRASVQPYSSANPQPTNWTLSGNNIFSNNSGNVGVGVTNPAEKLDINGNIKIPSNGLIDLGSNGSLGFGGFIQGTGNAGFIAGYGTWLLHNLYYNGTAWVKPRANTAANAFTSNHHLGFRWYRVTAGGINGDTYSSLDDHTQMVLNSFGDLGLGTTNPTAKLHVAGNALISNLAGVGTSYLEASSTGVLQRASVQPYSSANPQPTPTLQQVTTAGNSTTDNVSLTGRVGIGTGAVTGADLALDFDGVLGWKYTSSNQGIFHTLSGGGANPIVAKVSYTSSGTTQNFRVEGHTGIDLFNVRNGGDVNVPIGALRVNTETPLQTSAEKLSINGIATIRNDNALSSPLYINNSATGLVPFLNLRNLGGVRANFMLNNSVGPDLHIGSVGDIYFNNNVGGTDAKVMIEDATGNVGIGTTSPTFKLDVAGNVNVDGGELFFEGGNNSIHVDQEFGTGFDFNLATQKIAEINRVGTQSGKILINQHSIGATAAGHPVFSFLQDFDTGVYLHGIGQLGLATSGLGRVLIDNTGNVGIGTTNPERKLHIFDQTSTNGQLIVQGDTNDASIAFNKSGHSYSIGIDATDNTFKISNASLLGSVDRLVLSSTGSLTIPNLSGTGNRMVIANGSGLLSTQEIPAGDNLGNHTATTNIQLGTNYLSGDGGNEGIKIAVNGDVTIDGGITTNTNNFKNNTITTPRTGGTRKVYEVYTGDGNTFSGPNIPQTRSFGPEKKFRTTSTFGQADYGFNRLDVAQGAANETISQAHVAFTLSANAYLAYEIEGIVIDAADIPHYFRVVGATTGGNITNSSSSVTDGQVTTSSYVTSGGAFAVIINAPAGSNFRNSIIEVSKVYGAGSVNLSNPIEFRTTNF